MRGGVEARRDFTSAWRSFHVPVHTGGAQPPRTSQVTVHSFHQTVCDLGDPLGGVSLKRNGMIAARWRHADATVHSAPDKVARVVLSLAGVQNVFYDRRDGHQRAEGLPGHMALTAPTRAATTSTAGEADVLQIFVPVSRASGVGPVVGLTSGSLRRHLLSLAWTLHSRRGPEPDAAFRAIGAQVEAQGGPAQRVAGGLAPAARRRVVEVVRRRLMTAQPAPTVQQLARSTQLSSGHFHKAFKASFSMTPHQFILRHKHLEALRLMSLADRSTLADIGDRLGFSHPSHFGASFRRHMGIAPSEYLELITPN